jgi:tetratricopeptide (TPR) repeat protein
MAEIDQEIASCEAVLARLPVGSPDRPGHLRELAGLLGTRYASQRELPDLERVVQLYEQARTLIPAGSPALAGTARELGSSLRERYFRQGDLGDHGDPRDLDRATQLCEEAVLGSQPYSGDRPASLYELGMCLFERQFRDRSPEDLVRAIELLGQAAALAAPGHGDRLKYAHGYGLALGEHYERTGAPGILPLVIGVYASLLADPLTTPGDRPLYSFHLCRATWEHALVSPDPALLGQAIETCERAVAELPSDSGRVEDWQHRLDCLSYLASARLERGMRGGDGDDLSAAASAFGELIELCPIGTPGRYSHLGSLARALSERFRLTGAIEDLDHALEFGERSVAECPAIVPDRGAIVRDVALLYRERSMVTGPRGWPAGLDRGISLLDEAASSAALGMPARPMYLVELAGLLSERDAISGSTGRLDRVVDLYEEALAEILPDSPNRAPVVHALSLHLLQRSSLRAGTTDLERAIQVLEQAVREIPADVPGGEPIPGLLADALMRRFSFIPDARDLNRAIEILEPQARRYTPAVPDAGLIRTPDPRRPLAEALMSRYWHAADAADLDRAVGLLQQVVAEADLRDPNRMGTASMLALALRSRFALTGQPADLAQAIELFERVAAQTPRVSREWPGTVTNLAATLQERYASTRDPGDIDRAQQILEDAAAWAREETPGRAQLLDNLGRFFLDRYAESRDVATLKRAIEVLEDAWRLVQSALVTLSTTYKAGQQDLWSALYARLATGLVQLAQVSPAEADACHRRALVVAESAKSRLLADLVGRGELAVPPLPAPPDVELAARERDLVEQLTALDTAPDPADPRQRAALVTDLQQVWSQLADAGPEAADYVSLRRGDSPSWAGLARLAADAGRQAALVSVFVTAECTLLFVLRAEQDAPIVIRADLTQAQWDDARWRLYREVARSFGATDLEETWDTRLREALLPAVPHLAGVARLVISPMAAGHLLPWSLLMERAGWRDPGSPDGSAFPEVTVLPALGVLDRLRQRQREEQGPVLVVGNPQGDLGYAEQEAERVAQALGATPVIGSDATTERVLREIDRAWIVHLAAHASFAAGAPLASGVLLADGPLTAAQVMARRLRATVLTLSGCDTGLADIRGGDELAGLAQAFLQAGAHSLVVSLWAVDDEATGSLMTAFYEQLLAGPGNGAKALGEAIRQVRAVEKWRHPYFWGAFTYIGTW